MASEKEILEREPIEYVKAINSHFRLLKTLQLLYILLYCFNINLFHFL